MKRTIQEKLLIWKDSHRRKPLILRGARQVGKTWLVENVLAKEFASYVKIDFEKNKDIQKYFQDDLDPVKLISYLELFTETITPGKTLLFFDEIQACPRALMSLRYFFEEMPEVHVVAAGSLIEFALDKISFPVGRVQCLHVNPMSFYEYLHAIHGENLAQKAVEHPSSVSEIVQDELLREVRNYFFIGGMPDCVKTWRDAKSMTETFAVQSELLEAYRDDFSKYTPYVNSACLDTVFLNAAKSVGEQLKYTTLNENFTGKTNHKAFDLLTKAKLLNKIPSCNYIGLPLGATANQKKFKASVLDIGLMQRLSQISAHHELQHKNLHAMFRGKLAEQFVAQEILTNYGPDLFYWARNARGSSAEVDYLFTFEGNIYPIEVKSGTGGSLKSMHMLLEKYAICPGGFVLYHGRHKKLPDQKLEFLPLYSIASLRSKNHDVL